MKVGPATMTPGFRLWGLLVLNAVFILAFDVLARPYARDTGPGIVNLQLSFSAGVFTQIVGLWQYEYPGVITRVAWTVGTLDMLFPLVYAAFISRFYTWLRTSAGQQPGPNLARLPWVAAGFDYLENLILLWLLWRYPAVPSSAVAIMSMAAALKFASVTIALACTVAALLGGDRGRVLWTARYSVISLLVATVPLIYLLQGRDLLVSLTDSAAGAYSFSFLAWLTVWAFSVWYWSRLLLEAQRGPTPTTVFTSWARWTPRAAGALTLFLPGLACFLATDRTVNDGALRQLGTTCMTMGALFLWFTIKRRRWIKAETRKFVRGYSPAQVPPGAIIVFAVSALVSVAMFFWMVLDPLSAGPALGSVSVLVIAAANTVFIGSIVVFIGRWTKVPIEALAFTCAAIFSVWNDNHDVRLLGREPAALVRPTLAAAFAEWLAPLEQASSAAPIPVLLVAAEGGGIRAAYWAATVLTELDRQLPQSFGRHLFAVSSVSGGTIGAAVYAGLQRDAAAGHRPDLARQILAGGILAPITARLVTGDFLQWFIPFPIAAWDRSRAMEDSLEAAYQRATGKPTFSEGFLALPQGTAGVPLLFINATSVDTGRRVVTSPVTWAPPDQTRRVDLVDMHALVGDDLRVSTVVHNSSRFAYISPAGRVRTRNGEDRGHVVDGGYFENTGAETLVDLLGALRAAAGSRHVRFVALVLRNTPDAERPAEAAATWQETRRLGEAFAPLRAMLRSREARGELAVRRLRDALGDDVLEFAVCAERPGEAEPPLGWELSREMIARLNMQAAGCITAPLARLREVLR